MPNGRVILAFMLVAAIATAILYWFYRLYGQYQKRIEEARLKKWDKSQEKRVKTESEKILRQR